MIYPSIDKLLNIVDSKYELVHIAARRSKEISRTGHYQMSEGEYKCKKNMHDIPIGKPLEGYTVNIKNKNNEIGEIVISGKGVSRGYLNISENKERGFCIENNEKVYYTGDYGFEKNNELYILGRRDRQIKIKANKINLNEIE